MSQAFQNYIDGRWVESKCKQPFPNVNPADTRETVGLFQASGPEDVQAACEAAVKAQPGWAAKPAPLRGEFLYKAAEFLESRLQRPGQGITREGVKSLPKAKG